MKRFTCPCGGGLYFDNTNCLNCSNTVAFDPALMQFVVVDSPAGSNPPADGYRHCSNRLRFNVCNWVALADSPGGLCLACSMNTVVPSVDVDDNLMLWARVEQAKRRLLYSLLTIGLPVAQGDGRDPLRFRFLEDQSRNPDVEELFVATGHHAGLITVNLAEADDVARTETREKMFENYRTLLGHFRHEVGHYFLGFLVEDPSDAEFFGLFGDVRANYANALDAYYRNGPPAGWRASHISAYASAHPHEDWAETFAHFLHATDTLETAEWSLPGYQPDGDWIARWVATSGALNELNRSLGADLPYPFVLTAGTVAKLRYLSRRLSQRVGYSV